MRFSTKDFIIYSMIFFILFISGIVWLLLHYFYNINGEFGLESHPFESKVLCIHGFAAFAFMFIFGNIWAIHAKHGIQKKIKRNFRSGIANVIIFSLLSITGVILYYTGSDMIRYIVSLVHWVSGIAVFIVVILHATYRRRVRKTKLSSPSSPHS